MHVRAHARDQSVLCLFCSLSSVRSAITCDFSDLGSTGMGSGKADTAVETLDHLAILDIDIEFTILHVNASSMVNGETIPLTLSCFKV